MHVKMIVTVLMVVAGVLATSVNCRACDEAKEKETPPVLNFTMKRLNGQEAHLGAYSGKVVLMVNVASRCGYTKQYKALQELHDQYAEQGLAILGFPANEFGGQEPGSDEEIAAFCEENYGVKFDMFSKVVVKGESICDLYKYLTSQETDPKFAGDIKWNFEKFLINREGEIIARFESKVAPESDEVIRAIEAALAN